MNFESWGIADFFASYPEMEIKPTSSDGLEIVGDFPVNAKTSSGPVVNEVVKLKIIVPKEFPKAVPRIWEVGGKILMGLGNTSHLHINQDDGDFCLGSPLRVLSVINTNPTLRGFAEKSLTPYLYGLFQKMKTGQDFFMGELSHGRKGLLEDYADMFGLKNEDQILLTLRVAGLKKRIANKMPCPCFCGKRLGKCNLRFNVNHYRKLLSASVFRKYYAEFKR